MFFKPPAPRGRIIKCFATVGDTIGFNILIVLRALTIKRITVNKLTVRTVLPSKVIFGLEDKRFVDSIFLFSCQQVIGKLYQ